jgi:hypothetical protein
MPRGRFLGFLSEKIKIFTLIFFVENFSFPANQGNKIREKEQKKQMTPSEMTPSSEHPYCTFGNQEFCVAPSKAILGQVKIIICLNCGIV